MNTNKFVLFIMAVIAIMSLSCGGEKQSCETIRSADFLISQIDSLNLQKTSEIRVFVGDSLWEYINGGAELYHAYGFSEVSTAYYQQDETEIVVDIYQFETTLGAFGLFSMLRPDNATNPGYGIDGFASETNIVFVKGMYIVMLTGFELSEKVTTAIGQAAPVFEQLLPGITTRPVMFERFPKENVVASSDKVFADSFMGQTFLRDVFVQKYALGEDTLMLFATYDSSGAKFVDWKEQTAQKQQEQEDLPYDNGMAILITDNYYGNIVAGLKNGMLTGIVGYRESHKQFLTDWLISLTAGAPGAH